MGAGFGVGGGRGLMGTVTETASDHYTIKTETGETYTVHFSANTRIVKQPAGRGPGGGGNGAGAGSGGGMGRGGYGGGGNPPQAIKATDIKVGDAIAAMGEVDATAKSVGAMTIMQIDPERAKQMRELQANYGKTWLMGKVTGVDGVKVTIMGSVDNAAHTFAADENTTFRKRRDPITLADIQVGDTVRVEGAVKDGSFLATTVNAMGGPPREGVLTIVAMDCPAERLLQIRTAINEISKIIDASTPLGAIGDSSGAVQRLAALSALLEESAPALMGANGIQSLKSISVDKATGAVVLVTDDGVEQRFGASSLKQIELDNVTQGLNRQMTRGYNGQVTSLAERETSFAQIHIRFSP
jgi:hypothetical protein